MLKEYLHALSAIISIILVISSIIGLIKINRLHGNYRILIFYVFFVTIVQLTSTFLGFLKINNMPILHIYTIGEFVLLMSFFYQLSLKKYFMNRKIAYSIFALVLLVLIIHSAFISSIYEYNTWSKAIVQLLIISCCIFYFYTSLRYLTDAKPSKEQKLLNLTVASMLIYYSGSLFIFLFGKYNISLSKTDLYIIWIINAVLCCIFYMIILFVLCQHLFKKKKLSS